MIGKLRIGCVLLLALVAGPAFALGLGQIEVKSQRDQPLLAEIPIISADPAELEQLQVRLASPDTFARVGLEPPQGVVSDLQFTVALDAQGRPVIRVTSAVPVQQPLLTFLLEVDWGQGRLVREYSALLDAPRTVSAPAQPSIQAPTVTSPNTIVRPPDAAPAPVAAVPPAPEPPAEGTPAPVPAQPLEQAPPPTDIVSAPPPPAAPAAEMPAPVVQGGDGGEYGPVKQGDTLGEIASGIASGYSLDQTMLALLRTNPDAFIDGNINLVKQGAVLRMPQAGEFARLGADEAAVMVRDQIEQWREARRPAPQPAAIAGDSETALAARAAAATNTAPRVADARLEIVPPSSNSGRRAGTRSGIDAGGEGDMLRQELQQTKETLAARDSEVEELKARVADLEKLQQQQQQLITLKDSELAAAQQRLATSNQQAAAPAAAAATSASTAQPPAVAPDGNAMVWVWGGVALLALALLGWWLLQRRKGAAEPVARTFNTAAMAASIPSTGDRPVADVAEPEQPAFVDAAPKPAAKTAPSPAPSPAPAWNANAAVMPTWHADASTAAVARTAGDVPAAAESSPAGQERIKLARAYIDLGDVDTARSLLREVADSGDAAARGEASRLLRELA